MCSACFPDRACWVDASLPSTGSSEASSPASTVLSKRYDILPSVPPRFVPFAWRYLAFTRSVRSSADECAAEAWSWSPGDSGREFHEETTGSPKFLGNPDCPFAHVQSTPAGLRAPDHCGAAAWPLVCQQQRLPRRVFRRSIAWLSDWLRAPCEAWSASQRRLPGHHARLASGRWSGATGRALHPQGSAEKFQSCILTSHPPFPSFLAQ